ncbi:MAG: carboxypeptidase regulatory-like domain-containing protein [bacterium]
MKKCLITVVACLMLNLWLTCLANAVPNEPTGTVQGTIIDAGTNLPIPGVKVSVIGPMICPSPIAITDSTGTYFLSGLAAQSTMVQADKMGYVTASQAVTIIAQDTVTLDFSLIPMVPPATGAIQGIVTNTATGDPISGAEITIQLPNKNSWIVAHTDSTGYYLLNNLSTGSTVVKAVKPGFSPGELTVEVVANDTTTADFTLAAIVPPAQGAIQGIITNATSGEPIAGVFVYARPISDFTLSATVPGTDAHGRYYAITDSTGYYLLNNVGIGSTLVAAIKFEFESAQQIIDVVSNDTVTADFVLSPVTPPAQGAIQGTVTNGTTGEPIAGVLVYAKLSTGFAPSTLCPTGNGPENSFAVTDSTGYYLIPNLMVGDYLVSVGREHCECQTQSITVIADDTVTLDFTLQPQPEPEKGSIIGTVSDASTGAAIEGAFVFVSTDAASWYGHLPHLFTQTDSTGVYQLDNIPAGTQVVKVMKPGYEAGSQEIAVIAFDTVVANISLVAIPPQATGTITGTVSDASTGSPIASAIVFVRGNHDNVAMHCPGNVSFTTTDINGSYTLYNIATGVQEVVAIDSGYQAAEQQATILANETTLVDFVLVPFGDDTATVSVIVVEAGSDTHKMIPDATVFISVNNEILPTSEWDNFWGMTNITGHTQIGNVPSGNQIISVSRDGYTPQLVSVNLAGEPVSVTVSLTPEDGTPPNIYLNSYGAFTIASNTTHWYFEPYGDAPASGDLSWVNTFNGEDRVIQMRQEPGQKGKLSQVFSVPSTGWYTAIAKVCTDIADRRHQQKAYLYLQVLDGESAVSFSGNLAIQPGAGGWGNASTWREMQISFYAQNTLISVQLVGINPANGGNRGNIYLAYLWVSAGGPQATTPVSLTNPSFDDGTTGWMYQLYGDGLGMGTWNGLSDWAGRTGVLEGALLAGEKGKVSQLYTAPTTATLGSVWVYSGATSMRDTQKVYLYLYSLDSNNQAVIESGTVTLQPGRWTPGEWQQIQFGYPSLTSDNAVQLVVINRNENPSETIYFDDVEVLQ